MKVFESAINEFKKADKEADVTASGEKRLHMLAEFRDSDLPYEEIRDELITIVIAGVRPPARWRPGMLARLRRS